MCVLFKMVKSLHVIKYIYVGVPEFILALIAMVLSIFISIGSLVWGYSRTMLDFVMPWMIAFGVLWLFCLWQGWKWFSSLGLMLSLLFSIIGLSLSFSIGWMFSSVIFALLAWDMTELRTKMPFIPARDDVKGIERRHFARVSVMVLAGLLVASMMMLWWRQWTLEWGRFLIAVTLLGLGQLVAWLKK